MDRPPPPCIPTGPSPRACGGRPRPSSWSSCAVVRGAVASLARYRRRRRPFAVSPICCRLCRRRCRRHRVVAAVFTSCLLFAFIAAFVNQTVRARVSSSNKGLRPKVYMCVPAGPVVPCDCVIALARTGAAARVPLPGAGRPSLRGLAFNAAAVAGVAQMRLSCGGQRVRCATSTSSRACSCCRTWRGSRGHCRRCCGRRRRRAHRLAREHRRLHR